jgi:hypothetical protein
MTSEQTRPIVALAMDDPAGISAELRTGPATS